MQRKLTRQTIKPVLRFIGGWGGSMYSLNTEGATFYEFTLDTYNGKNSWQGGFSWSLDDALKYEMYAIDLNSGDVYGQDKTILFNVKREVTK